MTQAPIIETLVLSTPFPVGPANVHLLRGDPPALIDVGVKSKRSLAALEAALGERGIAFTDLGAILVTHGHLDHAGAAAEVARRSGAPVYCHPAAARDRADAEREAFAGLLECCGAPERLIRGLHSAYRFGASFAEPLSTAPDLRTLDDGDAVSAGGLDFTVLHTPGHCPGHICFVAVDGPEIFCGDQLLASITPNPLPHFDPERDRGRVPSLPLYLRSLDRLEALGPRTGLAGHGPTLADTTVTVRRNRAHVVKRNASVLAACREAPGRTVFELARSLFDADDRGGLFLALSETIAHLDLLEQEGQVCIDPGDGTVALR